MPAMAGSGPLSTALIFHEISELADREPIPSTRSDKPPDSDGTNVSPEFEASLEREAGTSTYWTLVKAFATVAFPALIGFGSFLLWEFNRLDAHFDLVEMRLDHAGDRLERVAEDVSGLRQKLTDLGERIDRSKKIP
jgi:hypothetical protein